MKRIFFVFLSPDFSESHKIGYGEDLQDAVECFISEKWRQGSGADERFIRRYGNWLVYEGNDKHLTFRGGVLELMEFYGI